jgi:hypothetical protein
VVGDGDDMTSGIGVCECVSVSVCVCVLCALVHACVVTAVPNHTVSVSTLSLSFPLQGPSPVSQRGSLRGRELVAHRAARAKIVASSHALRHAQRPLRVQRHVLRCEGFQVKNRLLALADSVFVECRLSADTLNQRLIGLGQQLD